MTLILLNFIKKPTSCTRELTEVIWNTNIKVLQNVLKVTEIFADMPFVIFFFFSKFYEKWKIILSGAFLNKSFMILPLILHKVSIKGAAFIVF